MNKKIKYGLFALLVIVVLLIASFWNQIRNTYAVYSIVDDLTQYIDEGNESYNLLLKGTFETNKKLDTVNVALSYENQKYFLHS